jgi:hypothetical protein
MVIRRRHEAALTEPFPIGSRRKSEQFFPPDPLASGVKMGKITAPRAIVRSNLSPVCGLWLSLVERLVRDEEAVGSNPTSPIFFCPLAVAPRKCSHSHHGFAEETPQSQNFQAQASQAHEGKSSQEAFALQGIGAAGHSLVRPRALGLQARRGRLESER